VNTLTVRVSSRPRPVLRLVVLSSGAVPAQIS
jgi:hypothetical protein